MNRLLFLIIGLSCLTGCNAYKNVNATRELNKGLESFKKGQATQAMQSFQQAMEIDPKFAEPAYYTGLLYHQNMKDPAKGAQYLKKALELEPDNPQIAYAAGSASAEAGQYEDAIASLKKAVELKPDFARAWFRLGNAYRDAKMYPDAVDAYGKSISADPQMLMSKDDVGGFAYLALANLYEDFDINDKAIAVYKDGIRTNPKSNRLRIGLGTAAIAFQDYGLAEQALADALELDPSNGHALFNRGIALMKLDKPDNAARSFKEFLKTGKGSEIQNQAAQRLIGQIEAESMKGEKGT